MINGIRNTHVDYFIKTLTVKTYGNFFKWPVGVSGRGHVVIVLTEKVCVHLMMVADFYYKDSLKFKIYQDKPNFFEVK